MPRELLDPTPHLEPGPSAAGPARYETHHNQHRPHRSLHGAAPLKPLPEPVNLDHYRVRKHAHVAGLVNEYRLVACRGRDFGTHNTATLPESRIAIINLASARASEPPARRDLPARAGTLGSGLPVWPCAMLARRQSKGGDAHEVVDTGGGGSHWHSRARGQGRHSPLPENQADVTAARTPARRHVPIPGCSAGCGRARRSR